MKDILQLFIVIWLAIFAYLLFPNQQLIRLFILITMTLVFIAWGLKQHIVNKTLSLNIILEYCFLGLLGIALVSFLLYYK
ncbi:hypothetical protein GYA49_01505 [Candidatus Beckwithbacteria bacterium]|nr:hypothetical protein [Candidatus Beckwithbacteria bacterium]